MFALRTEDDPPPTDLCRDCVEDLPVLEDDEPRHVGDDLPLPELLAHVDLNVGQPHLGHEVGAAHEAAVRPPVGRGLVDDDPGLLPHEVHVQLKCHRQ